MPAFTDVQDHNDELVRKALDTIVAVAPSSESAVTSILDDTTGDLAALPTGYVPLGRLSEDGASWARETEVSEIFGMGSVDPTRSDIRRAVKRVSTTLLEVRKAGLELTQGVSDLGETVTQTTGGTQGVTWDEPEAPEYPYVRLLAIARDITADGEVYIAKHGPRAKVTEVGEEVWSDQDQAMSTPVTLTFYVDTTEGTAMRHFRGGPGAEQMITDEGFTPAP